MIVLGPVEARSTINASAAQVKCAEKISLAGLRRISSYIRSVYAFTMSKPFFAVMSSSSVEQITKNFFVSPGYTLITASKGVYWVSSPRKPVLASMARRWFSSAMKVGAAILVGIRERSENSPSLM